VDEYRVPRDEVEAGSWRVWFKPGNHDFERNVTTRDAWVVTSPDGEVEAIDTLVAEGEDVNDALNRLAGEFVRRLGRENAEVVWRHFNPAVKRIANGERWIEPDKGMRPDRWPAILRSS
jgi:hypothetical protein